MVVDAQAPTNLGRIFQERIAEQSQVQRVWVLSERWRIDGEPDYLNAHENVYLFSSRERALAHVETLGVHPRWRIAPRNPDCQDGYATVTMPKDQVAKWHFRLLMQVVDEDSE